MEEAGSANPHGAADTPSPLQITETEGFQLVGLNRSYTFAQRGGIPEQWRDFLPRIHEVRNRLGQQTYGLCWNSRADGFDYLCGVKVEGEHPFLHGLIQVPIPAQCYAVFVHRGSARSIGNTFAAIHGRWLPQSRYRAAAGPVFECYGEKFDPVSGRGEVEIWLPVRELEAQE